VCGSVWILSDGVYIRSALKRIRNLARYYFNFIFAETVNKADLRS